MQPLKYIWNMPSSKSLLYFLLLILSLVIFNTTEAQNIRGALITGLNLTQVDGDEVFGYHKAGLQVGAAAVIQIDKKWAVSLENIFNQKGARQKARFVDSLDGSYRLRFNYLEVPLMLHYTDRERITVGAGLSYGRMVSVQEYKDSFLVESTTLLDGPYRTDDWNILADLRFRLYKGLKMNIRYAYSIVPIATRNVIDSKTGKPNIRDQYNNVVSVRLMYIFNEKQPVVTEPNKTQ